jgi:RNA polymerase sigma factor for flagellar operon FliA
MYRESVVYPDFCSEKELVDAAKGGDREALERLLVSYPPTQRIVRSLSRRHDPDGRASEELNAAARLGLLEALRRYEPSRGAKFTTYAFNFVRSEMLKAIYSQSQRRDWAAGRPRIVVVPLQSTSLEGDEAEDVIEREMANRDDSFGLEEGYAAVERRPSEEAVRLFVAELPENQREIVRDIFWGEMSHTEAAQSREISRPAVSRTLHRVFQRGRRELGGHLTVLAA